MKVSFRASEGVQLPGIDGRVESAQGSSFTPAGLSVWELGAGADPSAKANDDYSKRTESPGDIPLDSATFVFVTARRWAGKDAWVTQRKAERRWRDVRAYDADDLETWLELAPSVHLWFSTRIGVVPRECIDLEYWWQNWQRATNPALTGAFVLAGRSEAAKTIEKRLAESTRVFAVKAESQDESIAFLAATLEGAQSMDRDEMFARSVVVAEESAWRHLVAASTPLILIPLFDVGNAVASAVEGAHTVVLPLGSADAEHDNAVDVGVIAREPAVEILDLKTSGPRNEAWDKASLARRSMTAFRRHIGIVPSLRKPAWAQGGIARQMIPPLFLGSWHDEHEGDQLALAALGGSSYDELIGRVSAFTNTTDPLLRRRAHLWYLVSPQDAWRQLGSSVTRHDLDKFASVALDVLGVVDPRLELAPEKRWMSGMLLPPPKYSSALRRGIAATIGLLGSRAGKAEPGFSNEALVGFAERLVRDLFAKVRDDFRLWASLDDHLPDLAEGAPDVFLRELEHALDDPAKPLSVIFTDSESMGLFGPSSPHVDVLWALERLAWSPQYLARVVRILGRLDAIDPRGKLTNRPHATLRTIFLPWLPQTAATVDQRLEVLESWITHDPRAAWPTLLSMLPETHGVGHYSVRPRWHDWCPDEPKAVTHGEYSKSVRFAASKLIALAGSDGERWKELVGALPQFPEPEYDAALEGLAQLDPMALTEAGRAAVWDALRVLVAHHRNFAHAQWAMPAARVAAIDSLRTRFAPTDLVARFSWLFSHRPELPDAVAPFDDFAGYDSEIDSRRGEAVREIFQLAGVPGLITVALRSQNPYSLGLALGKQGHLSTEDEFLEQNLAHAESAQDQLACGYLVGRAHDLGDLGGRNWLRDKFASVATLWRPTQRALLLLVQRPTRDMWALAATDEAVAREYWRRVHSYMVADDDVEDAARQYLAFRRSFAAVELLGHHTQKLKLSQELILEVLEAAVFGESDGKPDQMFTYYVEKLFDALGTEESLDELRVGRLEWGLLPAISRHERNPKVLTRVFLRDPAIFVDAVTMIYKAKNAPQRDAESADEEVRGRASRAYELLRSIRGIPGTRPDGTVDSAVLRAWVDQARTALSERDRTETGTHEIGQLLGASSTRGADGAWPGESVRDLIDALRSDELDRGILMGLYNSRGVTSRSMTTGGAPERALASQYAEYAATVAARWPRTAALLRTIAAGYVQEARHHDQDVAIQEDLGV
ncbi:MAG TPA: hypothetical protein VHE78_02720 [Gemmatimonadaceae bacterium]|nr:hypothetical protein [Gemmatimonadaceae bacterium]